MIAPVQRSIEEYFLRNWQGIIHYSETDFHPNADEWIYLEVAPIYVEYLSFEGCVQETQVVYITCFAQNKVKSAQLADRVIAFMKSAEFDGVKTKGWRPISQGSLNQDVHFRKVSFPLQIIN